MMKKFAVAAVFLLGSTVVCAADDVSHRGGYWTAWAHHSSTTLGQSGSEYRHNKDLYPIDGYASSVASNCHRHVARVAGMRYHANTQCHRHDPWLHPSLDYGRN